MFYNPVLALVKASILVFLSRLGGHRTSVRNCIIALHCLNTGHAISVFFTALLQCLPMEANWNFMLRFDPESNARCIDNSFHVIASCLTILTDFFILALPFWIFLGLRMPWAAKLAVIGVFLMGSVYVFFALTLITFSRIAHLTTMFTQRRRCRHHPSHRHLQDVLQRVRSYSGCLSQHHSRLLQC